MELTPAELTLLGLVVERPQHGYELEQVIEQRGIRQWTDIGFSSIYYLLAKLEKRGLVEAAQASGGAKARRVFHATADGRDAAARGARTLIAEAAPAPHPVLAGIANLPLLAEHEYAAALGARLVQIDARIAAVEAAERAQEPLPMAASEVLSYSLSLMKAERSWLAARAQVSHDREDRSEEDPRQLPGASG
ncbi:PadR family transcriptional regulator [Microbacterium lushaniae]|uniref:PadR family transcriptional regulator n=1 Tax=Microbacterium lushaniae TaxID=2614639 RepID=A0A5J6L2T0_9MICO|nr:helix-turn-helix transcriptional regulator [Microbacterium lushaniae]QEW02777.1 PadR family transcriptional regulator [Microbacterium lushaniae]